MGLPQLRQYKLFGSQSTKQRSFNSAATAESDDYLLYGDTTAGALTLTLRLTTAYPRKILQVQNNGPMTGTNLLSIVCSGAETIEGAAQVDLLPKDQITLFADSDNGKWQILNHEARAYTIYSAYGPSPQIAVTGASFGTLKSLTRKFKSSSGMLFVNGCGYNETTDNNQMEMAYNWDGGTDNVFIVWYNNSSNTIHWPVAGHALLTPPTAGTHTLNLRGRIRAGNSSSHFYFSSSDFFTSSYLEF